MLEILGIVLFFSILKGMLKKKGRSAWFAVLGPVFWIGGELAGAVVGAVYAALSSGGQGEGPSLGIVYVFALGFGVVGAGAAVLVTALIPPREFECPACGHAFRLDLGRGKVRVTCRGCGEKLSLIGDRLRMAPAKASSPPEAGAAVEPSE